jgi:hypothetical protein
MKGQQPLAPTILLSKPGHSKGPKARVRRDLDQRDAYLSKCELIGFLREALGQQAETGSLACEVLR